MQHIYTRVSTDKQETDNQVSRLSEMFPDAQVHEEVASGTKSRPVLKALLVKLCKGDVLIVSSLDRLGRKTSEILLLIEDMERRGIILKSIREGVDYSTMVGKLVTQILCSVAEMERNMISERTKIALQARKKRGMRLGAKPIYTREQAERARTLRRQGLTVAEVAVRVGMSASRVSQLTKLEAA